MNELSFIIVYIISYVVLVVLLFIGFKKRKNNINLDKQILRQEMELINLRAKNNYKSIGDLIATNKNFLDTVNDQNKYLKLTDKQLGMFKESLNLTDSKLKKLEEAVTCCKYESTLKRIN